MSTYYRVREERRREVSYHEFSYSLYDWLYLYFNPEPEFTFHDRQEQEYSLHRARGLGLAGHLPAHRGKNKFSVDRG